MTEQRRHTGYDILRFASIFMVVAIHANVSFLAQNPGSVPWLLVMLFTALCTLSVPLFFMLSGALLLEKEEPVSLKEVYLKRIFKQAVPFVLWSVIYVAARIVKGKIPFSFGSFASLLWEPAYYQFWFMYTLLAIYLLLPILQALVKDLSKRLLEYALLLWFLFAIAVPTISYIVPQFSISSHVDLILCEGYIGYFLLGHYLHKYGADISVKKAAAAAVMGIAIVFAGALAEWFLCSADTYEGYFYKSYLTPGVALGASGVFLLFQNGKFSFGGKAKKAITLLSENALGVYYIHMLVLTALEYTVFKQETLLLLAGKVLSVVAGSLLLSFIFQKLPVINILLFGKTVRKRGG